MWLNLILFLIVILSNEKVDGARILCFFPTPSISHQIVYRPLVESLATRGHKLVVASTEQWNNKNKNITDIHLELAYNIWKNEVQFNNNGANLVEVIQKFIKAVSLISEAEIRNSKIQEILNDRNQLFDLVIVEYLGYPMLYALATRFNAPLIGIASLDASIVAHDELGNYFNNNMFPDTLFSPFVGEMSMIERIQNSIYSICFRLFYYYMHVYTQDELVRKYIGKGYPSVSNVHEIIDMVFINAHPALGFGRPVVPRMIDVTGIHIKKPLCLPKKLKDFLDGAVNGTIIFSLGTNVKSEDLPNAITSQIFETFRKLPYRIIWKNKIDGTKDLPENVLLVKWLPQNDVLGHHNTKLFIFHGGYQSLVESVSNGVPMIVIPFIGDQPMNANKVDYYGLGAKLTLQNITTNTFLETINTIITNSSIKNNVIKMSKQLWDSPQSPLERAVWWTEYVLRHNGTRHLRAPVQHLPFYQILYLDVMLFFMLMLIICTFLSYYLIKLSIMFIGTVIFPKDHKRKLD